MAEARSEERHGGGVQAVAVFRDEATAEAARSRLLAAGVPAPEVRVGAHADEIASLRAEMRSEIESAVVYPQAAALWPKEGAKSMAVLAPAVGLVATVVMLPVAAAAAPDWDLWARVLLALAVGAVLGGTVALVVGALGARGPAEPLAAEEGVTVRVASADPTVIETLKALDPIRLDVVEPDGTPTGETVTEPDDHAVATLGDRLAHQTDPDWEDPGQQSRA